MNFHDYLIERAQMGPRRELQLSVRTPMNKEFGELRFSSIENQPAVALWFQRNEKELGAANEGRLLLQIDSIEEHKCGSDLYEYQLSVEYLEPLLIKGRRLFVKQNSADAAK